MSKTLLVIDDSVAFRETITWAGEDQGWEVYAGEEPDEIAHWLEGLDEEHSPDVVLLDWQLPGRSRQKYAELLRKYRLTEHTLLLSGALDDRRREFIAEHGLAGAKLKPFDPERFEEEIRLPNRPAALGAGQAFGEKELAEMVRRASSAVDILDQNLGVLWSNQKAQQKPITSEQYLIARWLQLEINDRNRPRHDVAKRTDWDTKKKQFLESRLYLINGNSYGLERDWAGEDERPHDHEFLNLEEKNPQLDDWLRAVARLLAQRYAISRFRVYKIAPLPHTKTLEQQHAPLVVPKFQSGGGIEPDTGTWLRGGFEPRCVPDIEAALRSKVAPVPGFAGERTDSSVCDGIARIRYGEKGTYRVLFPVRAEDERIIALLALDRRLDHVQELRGFDKKVVEIAKRMASDEAGALSENQWPLMRGLIEDIGKRIAAWLRDDENQRVANWRQSISDALVGTFAAAVDSPEMTYEGISQVCASFAETWNKGETSGVRGATPWPKQDEKGPPISAWYLALINDNTYWQVVAGWGDAYETYRQGGQIPGPPSSIVTGEEPWKAVMIQDFQAWSKKADVSYDHTGSETSKAIGSWLAIPMQAEGTIRAVMVVHSPHAHYFTALHSRLMEYTAQELLPLLAAALRETRARSAFTAAVMHEVKNDSHAALMLLDEIQRETKQEESMEFLIEARHYLEGLNTLGQDTLDIFRVAWDRGIQEGKSDDKDTVTSLGNLIENATLGWRTLYEYTNIDVQLPENLAKRKIKLPRTLAFKRVLRVLLHNAFRHGLDWVHIAVELHGDTNQQLRLTIRNGAYGEVISALGKNFGSAMGNPGASPMTRGRVGLAVARQLTLGAGGSLGKLHYEKHRENQGEAAITLLWPIGIIS
uniref:CheY chemotaxis protein or a CheY-like REC (Receiver) domain n=1 Tax=Candidatus Kentrum sp. LFY TaxID=2126342 RepID=A0A450WGC1_9GAMM|nr:MAG: CheY chemotaxis protein or a CheY-like REC (receiver) domain [Candidatus Kentron sp. LFY]